MLEYDNAARRCNFVWCATNMMESFVGYQIPATVMDKIIGPDFEQEWNSYIYNPNSYHMDTCVREQVMNAVAQYYLGHPWPTYSDDIDMSLFESNLEIAILQGPQKED